METWPRSSYTRRIVPMWMVVVSNSVQQAVDRVSTELGLSILIEDIRQHPLWWCTVGPVDPVRTNTVLDRRVDKAAADVVREFKLRQATEPVRTPDMPDRGMWARWAIPVRRGDEPLGLLWVIDPDNVVSEHDLATLVELADVAAEEIVSLGRSSDELQQTRGALLGRLLRGSDAEAARELAAREDVQGPASVQVEYPAKQGGWTLPDGMSAHLARSRPRLATSGAPVPLVHLAEAVRRARITRRAVTAGAQLEKPTYDHLGAWLLIAEAPDSVSPSQVSPAIEFLLDPQREDLFETARTVLDLGGDVSAAADQLHLHRTTLYYRLDRIAQLAGVDLRDGRQRVDLQFALWLHAYRTV